MDSFLKFPLLFICCLFAASGCSRNNNSSDKTAAAIPESDAPLLGAAVDDTPLPEFNSIDPNAINGFALTGIFTTQSDGSRQQVADIEIDYESRVFRVNPDGLVQKSFWWDEQGQLSGSLDGASRFYKREWFHYDESRRLVLIEHEADNIQEVVRKSTTLSYTTSGRLSSSQLFDGEGNQVGGSKYIWLSNIGGFAVTQDPNASATHPDDLRNEGLSLDYTRLDDAGYMTSNPYFTVDPLNAIERIDLYEKNDAAIRHPVVTVDFDHNGNVIRLTRYRVSADNLGYDVDSILEFEYQWAGFPVTNLPLHVVRHQPLTLLSLLTFILK